MKTRMPRPANRSWSPPGCQGSALGARWFESQAVNSVWNSAGDALSVWRIASRMQLFWAKGWPWRLWFSIVPVFILFAFLRGYGVGVRDFLRWPDVLWGIAWVVLGYGAGLAISIGLGGPVMGTLQDRRVVTNGGPFKVGDVVQIIAGRFAGRIGRVYSTGVYEMVYVDVGEEARSAHQDLFGQVKLIKVEGGPLIDREGEAPPGEPRATPGLGESRGSSASSGNPGGCAASAVGDAAEETPAPHRPMT